jgi:hypothetical protein
MTSRTYNYTGRMKIPNECVIASLVRMKEHPRLDCQIDLSAATHLAALPENALVYVDAEFRSSFMRLYFGTVDSIVSPTDTTLSDLDSLTVAKITVRVVNKHNGNLLAQSNKFTLTNQNPHSGGSKSIIKVEYRQLNERPWKLEIYSDDTMPTLVLNEDWANMALEKAIPVQEDPQTMAVLIPQIFQTILERILLVERRDAYELFDGDETWRKSWIKFAHQYSDENLPPPIDEDDTDIDTSPIIEWIDSVVSKYCVSRKLSSSLIGLLEEFS